MLRSLKIDNIAVIESASLNFYEGLNILTGETGAGKSIVIDSINAILGERTSRELIRSGCDEARVVASFDNVNSEVNSFLEDCGIEKTEDNSLIISRTLNLNGKNVCRVNGWPVTVSQLKDLGCKLINIHGQHDNQALLLPENHCGYIDSLADNEDLVIEYRTEFRELIKVKKELDRLYDLRDSSVTRIDYLDFVINEITQADIHPGETEELNKQKILLQNYSKVLKLLEKADAALNGDGGLSESIMNVSSDLESASKFYPDVSDVSNGIKNLAFELEDFSSSVRKFVDGFSYDSEKLSEIDERLDLIYRLSLKYGKTEEDILRVLDESVSERNSIAVSDSEISVYEERLYSLSDRVKILADKLTESRRKSADLFEVRVSNELKYLDMPHVTFVVKMDKVPLTTKGADSVEFLISTNPGQEPKPVSKIASGGELSRIMLAIKNVLSTKDSVETLIFDEIDSGVSGSAAEKIALKLDDVSASHQVIVVTHLARIAAQADYHMKIEKSVKESKTFTKIIPLDFDGRVSEVARITAGNDITELQLDSAREMLNRAKEIKQ